MDKLLVFQKAVDALPYGVMLWEADSEQVDGLRLIYANPQASREANIDLERYVGRPLGELLSKASLREHGEALGTKGLDVALRQVPYSVPQYQLRVGDESRQFRVHLVPVWDRTLAMVYENLRGPSEEGIATQTRAFFEDVVETLHEPLLVVDAARRVVWSNQVFAELVGAKPGDLVGRELAHLSEDGSDAAHLGESLKRVLSGSLDGAQLELNLTHGDSTWTMLVRARRLAATAGEGALVLVALRDVSAERSAETLRREFVQKLFEARDTERRRVARELHDEVGQALALMAARVQRLAEAQGEASTGVQVAALVHDITALDEGVARLAAGLHPLVLDELGFEPAARQLLHDFGKVHRLRVDVAVFGLDGREFEPRLALTLYRMIQEGLTNVARHANATSVNVIVHRDPSQVRIVIEDDGVGFDHDAAQAVRDPAGNRAQRLGLVGLRERAALLGGKIEVESSPGRGTTLAISVPVG